MQKIPIGKAAKGMVIAKPVSRDNGLVLMGAGTELDEKIIERLKVFGIKKISVKGRPLNMGTEDEKTLKQLYEELEQRFKTVAADKFCGQIKEIVKKEIKRRKEESEL